MRKLLMKAGVPLVAGAVLLTGFSGVSFASASARHPDASKPCLLYTSLAVNSNVETFSGAFLVAVVALAVDSLMAAAGRALTPAGLRSAGTHKGLPALRYRALGRIPVVRTQGSQSKSA